MTAHGVTHYACPVCAVSFVSTHGETCATCLGDPVDHPAHYNSGGVEVIDVIEAWGLGFHLGNAVKYIARAGKKDPKKLVEDLKKASWYLARAIARAGKVKPRE